MTLLEFSEKLDKMIEELEMCGADLEDIEDALREKVEEVNFRIGLMNYDAISE